MTDLSTALRELVRELVDEALAERQAREADAPDRLYGLAAAAELMSVGRSFLFDEIARGHLTTIKAGKRRLVPASSIAAYIDAARERQTR